MLTTGIDEDVVRSIGVGGFIITIVCMLANLTLLPSLLIVVGSCSCARHLFLLKCKDMICWSGKCTNARERPLNSGSIGLLQSNQFSGVAQDTSELLPAPLAQKREHERQFWYRLGQFCKRHRKKIIVLIIAISLLPMICALPINLGTV